MDKKSTRKRYLTISLHCLGVILISIAFEKSTRDLSLAFDSIGRILSFIRGIFSPFILGLAMAYLVNPVMVFIEKKIDLFLNKLVAKKQIKAGSRIQNKHGKRILSLTASYVMIITLLLVLSKYLLPELISSGENVVKKSQLLIASIESEINNIDEDALTSTLNEGLALYNRLFKTSYSMNTVYDKLLSIGSSLLQQVPRFFSGFLLGTVDAAKNIFNLFMGVIISLYMLIDKEDFLNAMKEYIFAFFRKTKAVTILEIAGESNEIIHDYIIGNIKDSSIVGILFFIVAMIIQAPIPALLSVIIGVTNLIPYFGPWIGGIPVFIMVAMYDLKKAFMVALFILIIQQFDGLVLKPILFGGKTGLNSLGVTFAIFAGGALGGVFGMFFGVPILAMILNVVNRWKEKRLASHVGEE